jgi:hypothetical protein
MKTAVVLYLSCRRELQQLSKKVEKKLLTIAWEYDNILRVSLKKG